MIERSSEIKGKLREKVEEHVDDIKMSYFLATIKTDVPIELDMEALKLVEPNEDELGKLLLELEMKSFADRVLKKAKNLKKPSMHNSISLQNFRPTEGKPPKREF